MRKNGDDDFWDPADEFPPEGPPAAMIHLALTCNGAWGLGILDACDMRNAMRTCGDEPPVDDRQWVVDLEIFRKIAQGQEDLKSMAEQIAWAAYRQGIVHGEAILKFRVQSLFDAGDKLASGCPEK